MGDTGWLGPESRVKARACWLAGWLAAVVDNAACKQCMSLLLLHGWLVCRLIIRLACWRAGWPAYFLDQTARKPKVRFDIMAVRKPIQLKDSSAAEAMATPSMMGTRLAMTGSGVGCPRISCRQAGRQAEGAGMWFKMGCGWVSGEEGGSLRARAAGGGRGLPLPALLIAASGSPAFATDAAAAAVHSNLQATAGMPLRL